jgi:hypothetical protein
LKDFKSYGSSVQPSVAHGMGETVLFRSKYFSFLFHELSFLNQSYSGFHNRSTLTFIAEIVETGNNFINFSLCGCGRFPIKPDGFMPTPLMVHYRSLIQTPFGD